MKLFTLLALPLLLGCPNKDDSSSTTPVDDQDGDGYSIDEGDCDDTDAQVSPAAAEVYYTGIDEDCDPTTDDTDQDADGVAVGDDCVDTDASVYPGAEELCDGIDNDCSGLVDDGATGAATGWMDADLDGYGDAAVPVDYCGDLPTGVADNDDDCDDTDPAYNPGAEEACTDTEDYNCDGSVGYEDLDGDGYAACEECDDGEASVNPAAQEICNGVDDNCDAAIDVDAVDQTTWYADADADGYGDDGTSTIGCEQPVGYVSVGGDCNDGDATVNPAAVESCSDKVDLNCDGSVGYADADSDGWAACEECDDTDAAVNPDATEVCDGVDNNCDGALDGADAEGAGDWYADADGDSFGDATLVETACSAPVGYVADGTDCDDTSVLVNPDASELCDSLDNDCDGSVDEDPLDGLTAYTDGDGDGYGADDGAYTTCDTGAVTEAGDCDDGDAAISPGADEVCDGVDNDCDGTTDVDPVSGSNTWYLDFDGDGYGDAATTVAACSAPAGYVSNAADCDDTDAALSPDATEECDGVDNDCDGDTDESGTTTTTWYADADSDGYGDATVSTDTCEAPPGYVADDSDCDDTDPDAYPGAVDDYDAFDSDCDGWVDEDAIVDGDLIITEVHRQPRFGSVSTVSDGMWFELYNASATDIDLSNWYVLRTNGATSTDAFFVDPADGVVAPAGSYVVFCKTTTYEGDADASIPLACDYIWGDPAYSSSYEGYYHDNTFNLQRDEDRLALYVGGGSSTGTLIDDVTWFYDATDGYWPRDATRAMVLDPDFLDGVDNDDIANWCSAPTSGTFDTWWEDGSNNEYGSPGVTNYNCY